MRRSVQGICAIGALAPLTLLSYCSGGVVQFTVVNETDETVLTWGFYEKCEDSPGNQQDYFLTERVPPGESFEYEYGTSSQISAPYPNDEVRCVQVADERRRLLLSEPYERGEVYVVTRERRVSEKPLPWPSDLPKQSWHARVAEEVSENPVAYGIFAPFLIGSFVMFFIALPDGIYRSVRDLLRYRREGSARE